MEDRNVLERILAGSEEPRDLPLQILKSITENFSPERKIGAGGFGEVYKGVLQNGCYVALKRIIVSSHTIDDSQFKREVTSLLKTINHQNVVRFLGFCSNSHREVIKEKGSQDVLLAEIRERILCFEHIDNGSLDKHITDELRGHEWNIRYQIIRGICEGLQYLHEEKHIIHMDLKPTNIMVDSDMVPKITDFGLSRPDEKSRTTGDRFGSRGYCAPEYDSSGMTSFKCDIYSLGVIIAELVTGRKGIPDKNNVLRRWRHRWDRSARHTPLQDQQVTECQVTKCIEIAERCMENEPKERPSISDIIRSLNEIGNKKCHISDQISPSLDDDMLGIEPLELRFAFELNKEISRAVELTNGTCNCIAFNIETVSQLLYCTQPNKGIVPSRYKRTVKITLQAQETAPGHMHHPDEFIVQSIKVEDSLTDEDITEHMFNNEAGKVVDEVNLTVVYDEYNKQRVDPSLEPASKDINSSSHKDARGQGTKRLNFHPPQINSSPNVSCLYKASDRAVDLMTGAMGSLLPKLRQLLNQEHSLQTSVKKDVESIEEQLTDMHTALCNVSQEQLHQLDPQDKRWANKVRELSYDIEDIVDDLLVRIERSEPITNQDGFWGLIHKMFNLIKWGKTHYIARAIEDIKIRVKKVADRHEGFKLGNFVANPAATSSVDPRLLDFYKDHKDLVGIDGPRDELAKRLIGGDDGVSKQQLKIISIFGDGGLGKTTIAKALYDKLDAKFLLKAFVPVGRNPDMKVVLEDILLDLDKKTYADIRTRRWNEKNLIDELRDVLRNKRYLIVIDDIWDIPSWDIIKRALIDSSCGSKIITTSRIFEVAKRSGEVCKLEPLSNDDSKELFCARLFGRKGTCSFDLWNEQSTKYILQKCGGVPLAIITIASLLAGKPRDDWPKVYNSIGFGHEDNTDVGNTRQILLFSYYDLPWHLKTCLLYLSIFPEDREIEKDTLVWRWVAQGFVHEEPGKTLFKVGERYFHELINRSMIQPVEERGTYATICACRVHDMVLDMICSMAKEENFVTILGSDEQHLSCQSNARILAVQKRVLEQHDLASMLKPTVVRTFNATGCHISSMMSLLQSFQVLSVLSLEGCTLIGDTTYHLKNLSGLVHLRYLGLHRTRLGELPMEVGDLRFLQTLDLRDTKIEALPHSVTLLRQLKCLRTGGAIQELPAGMGNLTSLEELHLHLPADSSNFGKELGKLTELRLLRIDADLFRYNWNDYAVQESLSNLQKIEELKLTYGVLVQKPNWDGFSPSGQLRRLFLKLSSCRGLPVVWMNASLVPNLSHLDVTVMSVKARDLDHLGSLPELRSLVLYISDEPFHVVIAAGAFPKLRYCYLSGLLLTYQPGAMPCLEYVHFTFRVRDRKDANFDFKELDSLMYLPLLEEAVATIICSDAKTEEVQEAEAAVRHAIDIHPNCPIVVIFKSGDCTDEETPWWQRSKMMQFLLPKSQQRDLTDQQSNDDEGQQGAGEAEGSDSVQIQITDQRSNSNGDDY